MANGTSTFPSKRRDAILVADTLAPRNDTYLAWPGEPSDPSDM